MKTQIALKSDLATRAEQAAKYTGLSVADLGNVGLRRALDEIEKTGRLTVGDAPENWEAKFLRLREATKWQLEFISYLFQLTRELPAKSAKSSLADAEKEWSEHVSEPVINNL